METTGLLDSLKFFLLDFQQAFVLLWKAMSNIFAKPFYAQEVISQLDIIGVGSVPLILLTSFFTGAVLALQTTDLLTQYGSATSMGQMVAFTMIRELGPVLTALMFTGRVGAGIASELGGMVVSQQIDALRSLGTDYVKKLVTPRILACLLSLPLLTAICNLAGIWSGQVFTTFLIHQTPHVYWESAQRNIALSDYYYSLIKSVSFALLISMTACYQGLTTTGGTRGVGKSTTHSVVLSSILIIASDFFLTKIINVLVFYVKH